MRYLLMFMAGTAVAIVWVTTWDLLLGMPGTLFRRKAKDRIRTRETLIRMGQLRYILTVGVLRSGLALGLGMVTVDLLFYRNGHGWHFEPVKTAFLSLSLGLVSGAVSWEAVLREKGPRLLQ